MVLYIILSLKSYVRRLFGNKQAIGNGVNEVNLDVEMWWTND